MTAPWPGATFHLDLDGTVIVGRYIEVDAPYACCSDGTVKEPI